MSYLLLLFFINADFVASLNNVNLSEPFNDLENRINSTHKKWISQLMAEVMPFFSPWSIKNEECTQQGLLYKNHLANLTLWAVQMQDSSVMAEVGLLSGKSYNFGGYDQCIRVKVPEYNIQGKHCFAKMEISPNNYNITVAQSYNNYRNLSPLGPVWDKLKRVKDGRIKYRDRFYWTVCIPSACTNYDLQESLSQTLIPVFYDNGINVTITVDSENCEVGVFKTRLTTGTYAYIIITTSIFLIVLTATFIHLLYSDSYATEKEDSSVVLMFSIISNTNKLWAHKDSTEYKFIAGMKVISMFLIIYGHRMLMSLYWPLDYMEDREESFENFFEVLNLNGAIIVNTFLIVTGFLVFRKLLNDITKGRTINIPLYLFYEWARSTPIYLFVLCTFIFLNPLFPNNPLYKRESLWRSETCSKNLWSYILYINNYYDPQSECLLPAWYLAVHMQLYIICIITGYIYSKWRKLGFAILLIELGVSLIIPAAVTYYTGLDALVRYYVNILEKYYTMDQYLFSYMPTHMRADPYVIGMLTAVLLLKIQKKGFSFTKPQRIIGLLIAIILAFGSLFSAKLFYIPDRKSSQMENSLYVILHRTAWSLSMSWIILASYLHGFGQISVILKATIYVPLNKLSLVALLIHPLLQGETFLMQRQASYTNFFLILWRTCGDIMLTYIVSYFFHLIIEAPSVRLLEYVMKKILLKNNK